jgi:hypothetical protein
MPMWTPNLRYVERWRDRHGKIRLYFRRRGSPRVALQGEFGSDEFAHPTRRRWPGLYRLLATVRANSRMLGGVIVRRNVDPGTAQPLIGVHLLMLKGKVIYIGPSLNMPAGVTAHRNNGRHSCGVCRTAAMTAPPFATV